MQIEKMTTNKTHTTAVVLIPPEEVWEPIQALRRAHDRNFDRWMPHITLLYPFAERDASLLRALDYDDSTPAAFIRTQSLRTVAAPLKSNRSSVTLGDSQFKKRGSITSTSHAQNEVARFFCALLFC